MVLLLGCSGGTTPADEPPDLEELFPDACPTLACATATPIASTLDFIAAVDSSRPWTGRGEYTTGCLPASGDHVVTGTVTVRGDALAMPPNGANTFRPEPRFVLRDAPPGVTCDVDEDLFDFTICDAITITDTTIRLRTLLIDIHPAPGNFVAVVEVLAACDAPCGAEQFDCEASNTCWSAERDHCAYCLGGTNEACACWRDGELAPDGTACDMFVSGDVVIQGTCDAGACVTAN